MVMSLRTRAEIIHTLYLSESAIAALSSVNVRAYGMLISTPLTAASPSTAIRM